MISATVDCIQLTALHHRTIAVQFEVLGREQLLTGRGVYEHDHELGQVLRIRFPAAAGTEFVLAEDGWNGEIQCGEALGCDYLVRLN